MRKVWFLGCAALLLPVVAGAQSFSTSPCQGDENNGGGWFGSRRAHACELRRAVLPVRDGRVSVSGVNGAIEVLGEDRKDIALEARVTAEGSSGEDAQNMLRQIRIVTEDGIHAEVPRGGLFEHHGWSVSYKLRVPRHIAAELRTTNGGIAIAHVEGQLNASSTNGGLSLHDLTGSVHATTTNGGVDISLAGDHWRGEGLFASSTNGGISVRVPERFAAHLVAETTNGGISVDFPVTVQGRIQHRIDSDINGGGPPVHLTTTNGGVSLHRS
jgi:hypothetical protein